MCPSTPFFSLTRSSFTPCSLHHHQDNTIVGKKKNYPGRWKHKHWRHIEKIMKNETHTYLQNVWEPCWQMGAVAGLCCFHQITSSISRWHQLQPPHQIFSGALSLRQVGKSQITCRPVSHFKAKQQMSSLLFCGGVFLGLAFWWFFFAVVAFWRWERKTVFIDAVFWLSRLSSRGLMTLSWGS